MGSPHVHVQYGKQVGTIQDYFRKGHDPCNHMNRIQNWNDYFKLKKSLSWKCHIAGGVPAMVAFWFAEFAFLSLPIFDANATIFNGVDPMIAIGGGTIVGLTGSFFTGSAIAKQVWRLLNKSTSIEMDKVQTPTMC